MEFNQKERKKKRQHGIPSNLLKETKSKHVRKKEKIQAIKLHTKHMVQITIIQIHFKNNIKNLPRH